MSGSFTQDLTVRAEHGREVTAAMRTALFACVIPFSFSKVRKRVRLSM